MEEIFEKALGIDIETPWYIETTTFDSDTMKLGIHINFKSTILADRDINQDSLRLIFSVFKITHCNNLL